MTLDFKELPPIKFLGTQSWVAYDGAFKYIIVWEEGKYNVYVHDQQAVPHPLTIIKIKDGLPTLNAAIRECERQVGVRETPIVSGPLNSRA